MIIGGIVVLLLALVFGGVLSIRPARTRLSQFELRRREKQGDAAAGETLKREALLGDITSLLRAAGLVMFAAIGGVAVGVFGLAVGCVIFVATSLLAGAISRVRPLHGLFQAWYLYAEPQLAKFAGSTPLLMALIRYPAHHGHGAASPLSSLEELQHLAENAGHILTANQKKFITHSLKFEGRQVREIMTPRSAIDSVNRSELLGPLVLDSLHKTGHTRFPVVNGDVDHVVGVLHLGDLLHVDHGRHSTTAEKAMEQRVFYVREDQTLDHVLAAFISSKRHLFIVVNEYQETVGIVTLDDILGALLGRKIVDHDDRHEDLQAVARQ